MQSVATPLARTAGVERGLLVDAHPLRPGDQDGQVGRDGDRQDEAEGGLEQVDDDAHDHRGLDRQRQQVEDQREQDRAQAPDAVAEHLAQLAQAAGEVEGERERGKVGQEGAADSAERPLLDGAEGDGPELARDPPRSTASA
jgi:hypothetical protein